MPKGSVSHPIEGCPADRLVGILSDAYMLRRSIYFHFAVRLSRYDRKISRHGNCRMCRVHYVWSSSSHAQISSSWTLVFHCTCSFRIFALASEFRGSMHTEPADSHIMQGLPPNRLQNGYKPSYKPCTALKELLQTVQNTNRPTNRVWRLRNSYKPYKPYTNRHTNRARRIRNSYKPYKPYTQGGKFPEPQS